MTEHLEKEIKAIEVEEKAVKVATLLAHLDRIEKSNIRLKNSSGEMYKNIGSKYPRSSISFSLFKEKEITISAQEPKTINIPGMGMLPILSLSDTPIETKTQTVIDTQVFNTSDIFSELEHYKIVDFICDILDNRQQEIREELDKLLK